MAVIVPGPHAPGQLIVASSQEAQAAQPSASQLRKSESRSARFAVKGLSWSIEPGTTEPGAAACADGHLRPSNRGIIGPPGRHCLCEGWWVDVVADWEWDDTLFLGTAAHYQRGRLPYAPGLADLLAEVLGLDGRGRLVDVGCGPGTLALSLAHLFREIVGVDPDSGMIAEAERGAAERGVTGKAQWVRARAEDLPAGLGTFTVATFGQSFHWMDRDLVAATVKDMLQSGGALVHISDLKTETRAVDGLPHPAVPLCGSGGAGTGTTWDRSDEPAGGCCRTEHPAMRRRCSPGRDSPALSAM